MIAVVVFALTWLLIAGRRLRWLPIGRPAGALLGAVAMVATGALAPEAALAAIDRDTLLLLFGMMLITAYVADAGGFERLADALLARCRTGWSALWVLSLTAGLLSALLVNDTVALFLTPVVLRLCQRARLPYAPFLIALATSANLGSVATLVGNPQNMLVGKLGALSFTGYLGLAGPVAALGLLINVALLWLAYGRGLRAPLTVAVAEAPPWTPALTRLCVVGAGVGAGFLLNLHLGWTALTGAVALIVLDRKEPARIFAAVDWSLLIFFSGLFIVVAGLQQTGLVAAAWAAAAAPLNLGQPGGVAAFSALMALGAQVVSNVPMVLLVGGPLHGAPDWLWALLAVVLTVAGNLTLIGSVANIIVAEGAKEHYTLGFWEYLRFGFPSAVLVGLAGVPLLLWLGGWPA